MRWVASGCLLLAACGPVLLQGDQEPEPPPDRSVDGSDSGAADAEGVGAAGTGGAASGMPDAGGQAPRAVISVKSVDCGRCYELIATATGGVAPYRFEWEDGSQGAERRVCPDQALEVSVIAEDVELVRSPVYSARLEVGPDAACPMPEPALKLCVT